MVEYYCPDNIPPYKSAFPLVWQNSKLLWRCKETGEVLYHSERRYVKVTRRWCFGFGDDGRRLKE
jgi:hypothetical protein